MDVSKLMAMILALLFCTGCEHIFSMDGSAEYEVESEDGEKIYLVAYNPHGLAELVEVRRSDAFDKIVRRCGETYEIISEEISDAGRDQGRGVSTIGAQRLKYIEYKCTPQ